MRKVARGEMTTRNEVVLIVWGVGVSMKHSNYIKIIIFKPPKIKELSLPSGNKDTCYFVFVQMDFGIGRCLEQYPLCHNMRRYSNWGHEGRGGRLLLGDLDGGGVIGGRHYRSKQALEL